MVIPKIPKYQVFFSTFLLQLKDKSDTFIQGTKGSVSKAINKIVLYEGITFAKYMIEIIVDVSTRKTYEFKRIDTGYFEEQCQKRNIKY